MFGDWFYGILRMDQPCIRVPYEQCQRAYVYAGKSLGTRRHAKPTITPIDVSVFAPQLVDATTSVPTDLPTSVPTDVPSLAATEAPTVTPEATETPGTRQWRSSPIVR